MGQIKRSTITSVTLFSIFILTVTITYAPSSNYVSNMNYYGKSSMIKPSRTIAEVLTSPYNTTFLPGTNLTIREYETIVDIVNPGNSYNVSVLSIDRVNWYVHCDYFHNTTKEVLSFDSTVNRTSVDGFYGATNYYNLENESSPHFDYWINTSEFDIGYVFQYNGENLEVEGTELITMQNIGEFEVWRLFTKLLGAYPLTVYYSVTTGLFVCFKIEFLPFPNILWNNLTRADFGQIQSGYDGPVVVSLSPSNNTVHPNGTVIDLGVFSPYDIHAIYYQWDDETNYSILSSTIETPLPIDAGLHHLYITAVDSLTYANSYHFVFETNNDFPRILVNYKNNSRIQSSSQITILVINSNDTIFYNWDGSPGNIVNANSTTIPIPSEFGEGEQHVLNVSAMSGKVVDLWSIKRFVFIVDDTPPIITIHSPNNKSIIKGTVNIHVAVSERSNVTYELNNETYDSFIAETGLNYTIPFSSLVNGSYQLNFSIFDEAENPTNAILLFYIYSSAFDWNWDLFADKSRTIDVVDASETTWFYLTLLSKTNQNFNLTVLSDESSPSKTEKMLYIIHFSCDRPADIIFMTLNLPLSDTNQTNTFDVHQWAYWDNNTNQWIDLVTSYNEVSHSWEATYDGAVALFALEKTGETTSKKSVEVGGGQIPSFEFDISIIGLFLLYSVIHKRRKSKKIKK